MLSRTEKLAIETDLEGNIIGTPLDLSMAIQPEGVYFVPNTGEMWIVSEPNQIFRFNTDPAAPIPDTTQQGQQASSSPQLSSRQGVGALMMVMSSLSVLCIVFL